MLVVVVAHVNSRLIPPDLKFPSISTIHADLEGKINIISSQLKEIIGV